MDDRRAGRDDHSGFGTSGTPARAGASVAGSSISGTLRRAAPFGLFLAAVVFLSYAAGSLATIAGVGPSGYFRNAYRAGAALIEKYTTRIDPLSTDIWAAARTPQRGVSHYLPGRALEGLTLYASGHGQVVLMDMQGRVRHRWERPYSTVWDASAAVRDPVPDAQTHILKGHLYPNGDLLAIYSGLGDTPYGYGMVKLDAASQVLWKNLDYFHHDFAVHADGTIYGLTQGFRSQFPERLDHFELPYLDDYLVVVSPEGRTLKKISLVDAVNRSKYRRLLWLAPYYTLADPLHTNNVDIIDARTAARLKPKIPAAAPGQVLLSFRELAGGTIALLDVASEAIVWATRGSWHAQHDPDVLDNGNILLFDNRGHYDPGGQSRVIEVDPATGATVWVYSGRADHLFESEIRADQQALPNGNVLISESQGGRLLEVDRRGEIVWEYMNPVRAAGDAKISIVTWAQRIDPQVLGASFRNRINESSRATED